MDPDTLVMSLRRANGELVEYVIQGPVDFVHRPYGRIILDFNPEDLAQTTIHPPQKETAS